MGRVRLASCGVTMIGCLQWLPCKLWALQVSTWAGAGACGSRHTIQAATHPCPLPSQIPHHHRWWHPLRLLCAGLMASPKHASDCLAEVMPALWIMPQPSPMPQARSSWRGPTAWWLLLGQTWWPPTWTRPPPRCGWSLSPVRSPASTTCSWPAQAAATAAAWPTDLGRPSNASSQANSTSQVYQIDEGGKLAAAKGNMHLTIAGGSVALAGGVQPRSNLPAPSPVAGSPSGSSSTGAIVGGRHLLSLNCWAWQDMTI
jgi:hypothetical protein